MRRPVGLHHPLLAEQFDSRDRIPIRAAAARGSFAPQVLCLVFAIDAVWSNALPPEPQAQRQLNG
jgi:hypothetical protein